MSIVVETYLHPIVRGYLSGAMPFLDFEERFIVASWDVEQTHDAHLIDMAHSIICLMIDLREGDLTTEEFDAALWGWIVPPADNAPVRATLTGAATDATEHGSVTIDTVGTRHVAAPS